MSDMTPPQDTPEAEAPEPMAPLSDDHDDDLATLLAKRQHARPNRATWALLGLIVLAAGFVGGAFAYRTWGTTGSTGGGMPDFSAMTMSGQTGAGTTGGTDTATGPTGDAGGGAMPGQGGGFGGRGGATFGTVTAVDGDTLTITDSSGATVTVTVPSTATVTASTDVPLSDLAVGESVVVQGQAGDDGSITATSVTAGGGFGGGFGGPGGGMGQAPGGGSGETGSADQQGTTGQQAPSAETDTTTD